MLYAKGVKMAAKSYEDVRPDKWITIGGVDKTGKTNPTSASGYYCGRSEGPDAFNPEKTKTNFMIQTPEGVVGINGNTNLVQKMTTSEKNFKAREQKTPLGVLVQIKFVGTQKSEIKGRNPMKLFEVLFDASNVNEDLANLTATSTSDDSYDDEDAEADYQSDAASSEVDEDAMQAAELANLERKAKVQALLNKGKTAGSRK